MYKIYTFTLESPSQNNAQTGKQKQKFYEIILFRIIFSSVLPLPNTVFLFAKFLGKLISDTGSLTFK